MDHDRRFRDKTALVTGGASGIGLAIGRRLAASGAHVTLADLDADAAGAAAERINRDLDRPAASGCGLDVRDQVAVRSVVEGVAAPTGSIDLMFNNAGIAIGGPTEELTRAHWDRVVDVNTNGVLNGVLACYPRMVDQGHGHIVNTASGVGLVAAPYVAAYAASKHAVVGLSTALAPEAARRGIAVSVLCPGSVDTPILDRPPDADLPVGQTPPATGREYARVLGVSPMPADDFAERALRGVARRKLIIVEPPSARVLWYLQRLSPRLAQLTLRQVAARVDEQLVARRD